MRILNYIHSKPKRTRKKFMWLATGLSMVLVIIIWLLSFPKTYTSQNQAHKQNQTELKLPSFEDIKKNIKELKQELKHIKAPENQDNVLKNTTTEPEPKPETEKKPIKLPLEE